MCKHLKILPTSYSLTNLKYIYKYDLALNGKQALIYRKIKKTLPIFSLSNKR